MTVCPKCGNQWSMTTLDRVNVERIRKLEAEVNRQSVITLKEKFRAEKAEARIRELEAELARKKAHVWEEWEMERVKLVARVEKAETRVAELERKRRSPLPTEALPTVYELCSCSCKCMFGKMPYDPQNRHLCGYCAQGAHHHDLRRNTRRVPTS